MSSAKTASASTAEIGNRLEDSVAEFLRTDILTGAYGIPSRCRVRQKEKYWSAERNDYIIVDVAVEVFHPGATERATSAARARTTQASATWPGCVAGTGPASRAASRAVGVGAM